ncbi:hypothetical protein Dimus_036475 [Dionaea muscipula]
MEKTGGESQLHPVLTLPGDLLNVDGGGARWRGSCPALLDLLGGAQICRMMPGRWIFPAIVSLAGNDGSTWGSNCPIMVESGQWGCPVMGSGRRRQICPALWRPNGCPMGGPRRSFDRGSC